MVAESVGVNMGACISDCISWCVGAKVKEQGYVKLQWLLKTVHNGFIFHINF